MINIAPLLLILALAPPIKADATIGIPSRMPSYSKTLPKGMLGLSIELDRWPSWSGSEIGAPNKYFNQVLSNLASRTGHAVPIRVGANSEDRAHLQLDVPVSNVTFPPPTAGFPYPEATSIGIGEHLCAQRESARWHTHVSWAGSVDDEGWTAKHWRMFRTWGVNLNYLNETETVAQAGLIFDTFYGSRKNITSHLKLELMEIGDEPDHYSSPIFNTYIPGWDNLDYIATWKRFAGAVAAKVPIDFEGGPRIQFGSAAQIQQGYIWTPSGLLGTDILDSAEVKLIGTYSEHAYQGINTGNASTNAKVGSLLDKVTIRSALSILGKNAGVARDAGFKFVLGEANSFARHGIPGISDAAEAALWIVDYTLGAATVGIERVFYHEGIGYAYNLVQPIPVTGDGPNTSDQPTVQAGYYGALMGYGIYEDERLARVVAINYEKYYPDRNSTRLSQTVVFPDSWKGKSVSVKRFTTPATNATSGLLWAGQAFESPDGMPSGQVVEEWLNGTSAVIEAAEAALFCLKD